MCQLTPFERPGPQDSIHCGLVKIEKSGSRNDGYKKIFN